MYLHGTVLKLKALLLAIFYFGHFVTLPKLTSNSYQLHLLIHKFSEGHVTQWFPTYLSSDTLKLSNAYL